MPHVFRTQQLRTGHGLVGVHTMFEQHQRVLQRPISSVIQGPIGGPIGRPIGGPGGGPIEGTIEGPIGGPIEGPIGGLLGDGEFAADAFRDYKLERHSLRCGLPDPPVGSTDAPTLWLLTSSSPSNREPTGMGRGDTKRKRLRELDSP